MKKGFKRLFSTVLAAALAVSGLSGGSAVPQVYAQETAESGYEIYPTPHEISYQDGDYVIHPEVSVVKDEGIDEATQNRLTDILKSKGKTENAQGKTKIYLGIYNSGKPAAAYIQENYEIDEEVFSHEGAHYVISDENTICVLGKDTDAVFYGLTSLKHIFNQMDGSTIRNFTIKDYADTSIRGFIEGYYGLPWSNEDRISLMEFGGDFKMTSYVFAPKDDPYHSSKWRELYPDEELAEIAEMAAAGNAAKCRFVWTIHPFMHNKITPDTYDRDMEVIKAKFEQLYGAGVRQFGVLADDSGNIDRQLAINVMNDLQEWVDSKGDVYDLVFCPGGYNDSWQGDYSELNAYDEGFDDRIKIFWTGQAVCQPISQETLTNFRTKRLPEGKDSRRAPLFWLNWPVNDINMSRLLMGKGSLLHTDINVEDLAGAVTNPMQDAQASKVAIFAVADYAWNVKGFDDDVSWADSFKYVDADAADALHTIAKHMSDPSPNNHGLVLAESEELKPLLDEFMAAYEAATYDAEKAEKLIEEFEIIAKACDDFHALSKNAKLKEELLPFTNALKDLANANISFLKAAAAIEEGNNGAAWQNYSEGSALLTASKNHDRVTISGTTKAIPASKWLRPFTEKFNSLLAAEVGGIVDDTKIITNLITNRTDTPDGALEKLLDNDEATEVLWKNPNSTETGDYIGLSYNRPITVNDITFKMGRSGNAKDTFQNAKLQYTTDGKEWTDIEGTAYDDGRITVTIDGLNIQAKGIRLCATADKENMWLGCKDIIVNKDAQGAGPEEPETPREIRGTGIYNTENMVIRHGNTTMMTDGEMNKSGDNYAGFAKSNTNGDPDKDTTVAGAWVGMTFDTPQRIASFTVNQGTGDHIDKGTLEYTEDGTTWQEIGTYDNIGEDFSEEFAPVTAKGIRLVNKEKKSIWWRIYEMYAEAPKAEDTNEFTYTNVEALESMTATHTPARTAMVAKNDITLQPNKYIGLKLDRIKDITNIDVDTVEGLTLQTSKNAVIWTDVTAEAGYEDARYIRWINKGEAAVTFDLTKFAVESHELEPVSVESTNVVYYGGGEAMKGVDKDRTTEVIFNHSQIAGDYVTYDLGQVIDLTSIALVSKDSAADFPRHAKISVSVDGAEWTDVLTIGDQNAANPGEAEGTDNIMDVLPDHEVSSNVKRAEGLNVQARYVKFEVTRTKVGPDKWTRFTEIELNGEDFFLAPENDPTITTGAEESAGNLKGYLIDGDVATTYRPVGDEAGELTYYLSENTDRVNKLTILQSPSVVSNATVTAEVINTEGAEPTDVVLGTLRNSLNEFNTGAFANVLSVTVSWEEGNVPEIHEMIVSPTETATADKEALQEYYNENKDADTSEWTPKSREAFEAAKANAEAVLENAYATQSVVDSALKDLTDAVEHKALLGNFAEFAADVNELKEGVLAEENYLPRTWAVYTQRLAAAEAAIEANSATQEELDLLLAKLTEAKEALVYEVNSIEQLQLAYEEAKSLAEEDYTAKSYQAVQALLTEVEALLAEEAEERQNPQTVKALLGRLDAALDALVSKESVQELSDKLAEANDVKKDSYMSDGVAALEAAIAAAETAVGKGDEVTKEEVETAMKALTDALAGLKVKGDKTAIVDEIERLKKLEAADYTSKSYEALMAAVAEAEEAVKAEEISEEDCQKLADRLNAASGALVEVKALKAAIAEAKKVSNEDGRYTAESYAALTDAISAAEALLENGTDETIPAAVEAMAAAEEGLRFSVAEVAKLTAEYETLLDGSHTKASEAELKAVIDAAKADAAAGNVTKEKLAEIEKALAAVVLVDVTELQAAIKAAEEKAADEKYTTESRAQYQAAIDEAKALLEDGTLEQIETAVKELKEKESVLVLKGDLSKLSAAYEEYAKIDLSKYTADSAKVLKDELNIVKFILDNGVELTDAQIEEHIQALANAKKGLTEKPAEPTPGPDHNDQGGGSGSGTGGNGGSQTPQGGSNTSGAGAKTGDTAMPAVFAAMLAVALCCTVFFRKKRVR